MVTGLLFKHAIIIHELEIPPFFRKPLRTVEDAIETRSISKIEKIWFIAQKKIRQFHKKWHTTNTAKYEEQISVLMAPNRKSDTIRETKKSPEVG